MLPASSRRACIIFWPTFLKIAPGWRHLAKRICRLASDGGEGGGGGGGEAHSCQPLRTANRNSYIQQHSHGSAAPSQWRREKWESGCVHRQEGNNRWRSPPCFSQDGGAAYGLLDRQGPIRTLRLIAPKIGGQSRAEFQLSIKPISEEWAGRSVGCSSVISPVSEATGGPMLIWTGFCRSRNLMLFSLNRWVREAWGF